MGCEEGCLRNWPMAEILGDSLAGIMPDSVSVGLSLARVRAGLRRAEVVNFLAVELESRLEQPRSSGSLPA